MTQHAASTESQGFESASAASGGDFLRHMKENGWKFFDTSKPLTVFERLEIRLADEWIFSELVSSALRDDGQSTGLAGNWQLAQERRKWRNQIAERDARIQHLERSLDRLEHSGTLEVGRLFVKAGRSPREAVHLPGQLMRLWRGRR